MLAHYPPLRFQMRAPALSQRAQLIADLRAWLQPVGVAHARGSKQSVLHTAAIIAVFFSSQVACSVPTNTTGPVGSPVGEPPGGSMLIARVVPLPISRGNLLTRSVALDAITP